MLGMPTLTPGSSLAFGMSREGPSRRPLAFVPTQSLSRLMGISDGIVTKPYDLTFTQVICRAGKRAQLMVYSLMRIGKLMHRTCTWHLSYADFRRGIML